MCAEYFKKAQHEICVIVQVRACVRVGCGWFCASKGVEARERAGPSETVQRAAGNVQCAACDTQRAARNVQLRCDDVLIATLAPDLHARAVEQCSGTGHRRGRSAARTISFSRGPRRAS